MRAVVCDYCGKVIAAAIYPVGFGHDRLDACSIECRDALAKKKVPA